MGICYSATCLDCKTHSPIGWAGYFGAPSLSEERRATGRYEVLPFGYLYAPFIALGIRPHELEAFRDFLTEHQGHRLCQWSDADSELPAELRSILDSREEAEREIAAELATGEQARAARLADGTCAFGRYTVWCPACAIELRAKEPEYLLARSRGPLSAEAIASFLSFVPEFDPEDHSRPPFHVDSVAGFVESLEKFLREHGTHGVEAWVAPEAALRRRAWRWKRAGASIVAGMTRRRLCSSQLPMPGPGHAA